MPKRFLLSFLLLSLTACAGTVQTNTARALLTLHDTIKPSAEAASAACDLKLIPPEPCSVMKQGYDAFKVEWPLTDDALKVYLQAGSTGEAEVAFQSHYWLFMSLYSQLFQELLKNGIIKSTEGVK